MRFSRQNAIDRARRTAGAALYSRRVFAWLPVRVSTAEYRWLEFVNRRHLNAFAADGRVYLGKAQYRAITHGELK